MSNLPLFGESVRTESCGMNLAASSMTSVTGGSRAWGSYVELSASTSFEYGGFTIFTHTQAVNHNMLRIAIGAAASEVVIADLIPATNNNTRRQQNSIYLPVRVPAGARIAVAAAVDNATTSAFNVGLIGHGLGPRAPQGFSRAYGYGVAITSGNFMKTLTASATPHAKGSYTQLDAATAYPMKAFMPVTIADGANSGYALTDFAIGAAASEVIIYPDMPSYGYSSTQDSIANYAGVIPCNIPAGVRIAARCQSDVVSYAQNRVALIGLD